MKHITNTMKTFISLALCSSMLTLAISCKEMKEDIKTNSKEFYEGGIHFTITHGCPLVTKTSIGETESLTITGNLEDKTATMYVVEKRDDSGLTFSESYLQDGTKVSTSVIHNDRVVCYEVSPELEYYIKQYDEIKTSGKIRDWIEQFKECTYLEANKMSDNVQQHPIDRAACEWLPCETIILFTAAFQCATK
ncbi:MAG: hypothetical protein K2G18_05550 [Bacteroidales bacterium]|nr:hypothetical protein [Bacteroidales bacterium]